MTNTNYTDELSQLNDCFGVEVEELISTLDEEKLIEIEELLREVFNLAGCNYLLTEFYKQNVLSNAPEINNIVNFLEEIKEYFEDNYRGAWCSIEEYAEDFIEDCYGSDLIKDDYIGLSAYITFDYEFFARDLLCSGEIYTIENVLTGKMHIFLNQ